MMAAGPRFPQTRRREPRENGKGFSGKTLMDRDAPPEDDHGLRGHGHAGAGESPEIV